MISALRPDVIVEHATVSNKDIEITKASTQDMPARLGSHFYSPTMGEARSLAVAESQKKHGIGRLMVDALVYEAKLYGLDAVLAFTYVEGFFAKAGVHVVERGGLAL